VVPLPAKESRIMELGVEVNLRICTHGENIRNQKDIIGRADVFEKQIIDGNYPKYILENINKFLPIPSILKIN
jgi:hypothetical protein